MIKKFLQSGLLLAALILPTFRLPAAEPMFEKVVLFEEDQDGFRLYRIPGLVVTARGTVLAYCEARKFSIADRGEIEIHLRRSVDGGRTWEAPRQIAHMEMRLPRNPHMSEKKHGKDMGDPNEQTVNNPVAVVDRDGTVHFLYCVEYMHCFYMRSEDDGVTWSEPINITATFDQFRSQCDWQAIATGPGHGVQMDNDRLVVPVWLADYEDDASLRKASSVIYSDDGGCTWQSGDIAIAGGGEANVAQLSDGRVILSARNGDPRNRRTVAFSPDGATDWSESVFVEELLEPGCMAGLISHSSDGESMLLYSNPHTTERPHKERKDLTIKVSYDDGRTWPLSKTLQSGPSAYSDLAVLPDGTILCFYESGEPKSSRRYKRPWQYSCLALARFNLNWMTD